MELPQKIKQPEERTMHGTLVVTHLSPTELKINELIDYLESQKEGEQHNNCADKETSAQKTEKIVQEDPKCSCAIDNVGGNCKWCREEPKQIDVEALIQEVYELGVNERIAAQNEEVGADEYEKVCDDGLEKRRQIINTFKQALQQ